VYIKEWQDRKDGLDEEQILSRRYQREQEAEQEMIQEMSVLGRIKKFERMAKKNKAAALFPKSSVAAQYMVAKRTPEERAAALASFIKAANQTLESLSDRVTGTATEKTLSPGSPGSPMYFRESPRAVRQQQQQQRSALHTSQSSYQSGSPSQAPPRIIDTQRGPRALNRPPSVPKAFTPTPLEAAFKSVRLRRFHNVVSDLDLGASSFDPYNPLKRPAGWADMRTHRVDELEAKDRSFGVDESIIARMRPERLVAVRPSR
jgi:hypothetical protein